MSNLFERVTVDAMALPAKERELLADLLWESVDADDDTPLHPAWEAEIARRIKEIDGGAETIPVETVLEEMHAELRRLRA